VRYVCVDRYHLCGLVWVDYFESAKGPILEFNVARHVCVDRVELFRVIRPSNSVW
jgi:hypothetical protein